MKGCWVQSKHRDDIYTDVHTHRGMLQQSFKHTHTHTQVEMFCWYWSNTCSGNLPLMQKAKITAFQLSNCQQHDQRQCHHRIGSKFPPPTEWFVRCPVSISLLILRHKQTHTNTHAVGWKLLKPLIISGPLCRFPLVLRKRKTEQEKRERERELFVLFNQVSGSYPQSPDPRPQTQT